uniref:Uncharacterized protein n=1 Tax=Fagus sylvatica TaxID=28930 RepID=A0A2N9GHI8_FAGSY
MAELVAQLAEAMRVAVESVVGLRFAWGGGGVDLVAVRYGWLWVWVCVGLGFDLAVGVGVGFDLAAGVGDRFGRGLLGWVWEGMGSAGGDG